MRKLKGIIIDRRGSNGRSHVWPTRSWKGTKGRRTSSIVGIRTRGEFIARRIVRHHRRGRGNEPPLGTLDITLYRDDLLGKLEQPRLKATDILFDMSRKDVILVDDVLFTGRTIRAALGAIDLGRPEASSWRSSSTAGTGNSRSAPTTSARTSRLVRRIDPGACEGSGRRGRRPADASRRISTPRQGDSLMRFSANTCSDSRDEARGHPAHPRHGRLVPRGPGSADQEGAALRG